MKTLRRNCTCSPALPFVGVAIVALFAHGVLAAEAAPTTTPDATAPALSRFLSAVDLEGIAHQPLDTTSRGVAIVFIASECPVARQYVPELNRLAAGAAEQSIDFYAVLSEASLSRAAASAFADEFAIEFPVLFDASGEFAAAFQPTHVPESFLVDRDGHVVYRGRIDDRYADVNKKRAAPQSRDLADAIAALAAGESVAVARTEPVGCRFESPAAADAEITFARHIAPILHAKCAECHRPGEVAPFSLLSYDDAAKRAEWIRDVTASRIMPPWQAEIGHGRFLGERRLTDAEQSLITRWAESGANQGNPEDLPPQPKFASGWRLGEPDLIVEAPADFEVPADGPDVFQHWVIPLDLPEDKILVGFEFRPGNPAVVHHAVLLFDTMGVARQKDASTPEPGYTTFGSVGIPVSGVVGVWTPGVTPRRLPENIGMVVPGGADLVMQLHMHPSGKAESDRSKMAFYFTDRPVERTVSRVPLVGGTILLDIPAGESYHRVSSKIKIPAPITLNAVLPHMHLIGKEMKVTATLPNGTVQPLMWIRDWNFYWQDNYVYAEPVRLPAGTEILVEAAFDNSADNPLNPSTPPQRVMFGNGSNDEMCFAICQVIADDEAGERRVQQALVQSFIRDWTNDSIADDAREYISREAAKLFGGNPGRLLQLIRRNEPSAGGE